MSHLGGGEGPGGEGGGHWKESSRGRSGFDRRTYTHVLPLADEVKSRLAEEVGSARGEGGGRRGGGAIQEGDYGEYGGGVGYVHEDLGHNTKREKGQGRRQRGDNARGEGRQQRRGKKGQGGKQWKGGTGGGEGGGHQGKGR